MKVLDLKIRLLDLQPPIWRRVLLSPELTLAALHRVIQVAMGWDDVHAYRFHADGKFYSDPRLELEDGSLDARKIRVGELFRAKGNRVSYEYDFGDDWRHEVFCEEILESDEKAPYASCIGGARACPPEDCGGAPGYAEMLETLKSNSHPGHKTQLHGSDRALMQRRFRLSSRAANCQSCFGRNPQSEGSRMSR